MKTTKIKIYANGKDLGWLGQHRNWWYDDTFPHAFSIFDLDSFYQNDYFKVDHVANPTVVRRYVELVLQYGKEFLGREVATILELGCGGGWFTEEFIKWGVRVVAVEGSRSGFERTKKRLGKKYTQNIYRHDLRLPFHLKKKFNIVVCTEVAEHIEPPFSSQLVQTITEHSDLVWFSFEQPSTNQEHYHHTNEQPEIFWQNLFAFYGYNMLRLPESVASETAGRGGYLFYNSTHPLPRKLKKYLVKTKEYGSESLGHVLESDIKLEILPQLNSFLNWIISKW